MSQPVYDMQRAFSDGFVPAAIELLDGLFGPGTRQSTDDEDIDQAADFVLADGRTVSWKVRRPDNARYARCLVLRSEVRSGRKTEFQKVVDGGLGDLYLYCVGSTDCETFLYWYVADLRLLRKALASRNCPYADIDNYDGSHAKSFELDEIPHIVVAEAEGMKPDPWKRGLREAYRRYMPKEPRGQEQA